MDDKISAILEKVSQERNKGNFEKAIKRLTEAIEKHREEIQLYSEAIDVSLESGESLQASQFFKKACAALPRQRDKLWSCVKEMVKNYNDPVLAKFLLEQATKRRDLESGREVLENLEDHTASDLLKRTRIKMQTLSSALRGGYTLKGELIINALSEALLCLRVGRIREAAKTFVRILDEKPVENEVLEPFFCRLEKSYPNEAAVRYALGCCHIVSERFEKAFAKFIQCARMNPAFGDDIMERLRSVKSRMDPTPDDLDATMAETLLLTEDILGASEIISSILEKRPGKAAFVLELLYPRLGKNTESLILDYLFIEAALLSKQSRKALEHIKAIYQKPAHKKDILDWLEKKSKECFLPPDVLIFYGETALAEKMIEKGIEILREAISASANDAPVILHILEKFKDQDQEIESFYREIADNAYASADPAELDIEHFGSDQFYNASLYSDSVKLDRDRSAKAPESEHRVSLASPRRTLAASNNATKHSAGEGSKRVKCFPSLRRLLALGEWMR